LRTSDLLVRGASVLLLIVTALLVIMAIQPM
jgi:hypothetical protein